MTPCNLHTCSPFGATVRSRVSCICVVRHIRHLQRTFHTLLLCSAFLKRSTPEIIILRIMINVCGPFSCAGTMSCCTLQRVRSQEITIGHVPDRAMPADFLTKWIGASKLNVSVEHVTNSRHAPKRPAEQSMNGLGGVLDGRLGPDDCIRSGT